MQVTLLRIPGIQVVNACAPVAVCPAIVVQVVVETDGTDPVSLTVSVAGQPGDVSPRSHTTTLSGATSYQVLVPPGGSGYPWAELCPSSRHTIGVTAQTTPSAPTTATASRSCNLQTP